MGRQACFVQDRANALHQIGLAELHRRHIHRHHEAIARLHPFLELPHRRAQYPFADRQNHPALFRHRNELCRRHLAQFRVLPAQQGLRHP